MVSKQQMREARSRARNWRFATRAFQLCQVIKDKHDPEVGFTLEELCKIIFPEELDREGNVTLQTRIKMRQLLHNVRKQNPSLILYSVPYLPQEKTESGKSIVEHRYFNMTAKTDIDDVIKRMETIVEGLEKTEDEIARRDLKGAKKRMAEIKQMEEKVLQERARRKAKTASS